jgi:NADPH:quinone reductase-like Zn-dependent oxidoreductase
VCPPAGTAATTSALSYDVLGYQSDGGYAELVAVPFDNLVPIPEHIGFVEAAAFPLTFLTAWHMLVTRAELREGDCRAGARRRERRGAGRDPDRPGLHGARVLATSGPAKTGAHAGARRRAVFDHYAGDFSRRARGDGGRGVDVVIEHVGEATWERSVRSLARGGRLVTCGATTGPRGAIDLRHLFARQLSLLGSYMGRKSELRDAAPLLFDGTLRPVVDDVLPLSDAAAAHRRLESGQHFGKIVLLTE